MDVDAIDATTRKGRHDDGAREGQCRGWHVGQEGKVGTSCALCHTMTDASTFKVPEGGSIGHRLDGLANHSLNIGAILMLARSALYRCFDRHADESQLLERFNRLHPDDRQRTRVNARLSKVHALLAASRTSSRIPLGLALRHPRATPLERRLQKRMRIS